jgi:hypothetical protein
MKTRKCIVCSASHSARTPKRYLTKTHYLDEQLSVIFFLTKFLHYPILPDPRQNVVSSSSSPEEILEFLLRKCGNPSQWISFCPSCHRWIKQAKKLHRELTKIEFQLKEIRTEVEGRLWKTYKVDEYQDESGEEALKSDLTRKKAIRLNIRRNIYNNCVKKGW